MHESELDIRKQVRGRLWPTKDSAQQRFDEIASDVFQRIDDGFKEGISPEKAIADMGEELATEFNEVLERANELDQPQTAAEQGLEPQ